MIDVNARMDGPARTSPSAVVDVVDQRSRAVHEVADAGDHVGKVPVLLAAAGDPGHDAV
jgi:hypothetical protein